MNKKTLLFFGSLVSLIAVMIMFPLAKTIIAGQQALFGRELGESQILLLRTYEKGERVLFYIDRAAQLSFRKAFFKIMQNAGAGSDCKEYNGYVILNSAPECTPTLENFKNYLIQDFESKFTGHLGRFTEAIPQIEYDYKIDSYDNIEFIGKAKTDLRIDVDESDIYNFKLINFRYVTHITEQPLVDNNIDEPEDPSYDVIYDTEEGACQDLVQTAIKAIEIKNCKYAEIGIPEDPECKSGLSCVQFNNHALLNTPGHPDFRRIYRHGLHYCTTEDVVVINRDELLPGDFVSVTYNGGELYGHTAMYVGRGYLSDPDNFWNGMCYLKFTPDPNGEPIYAGSMGWKQNGVWIGRSCYTPESAFFDFYKSPTFCRHKGCLVESI